IGMATAVYVDGSFITDKTKPSDIDLVFELPAPSSFVIQALQRPEFDHVAVKERYSMDVWTWRPGGPSDKDWIGWFQEIKPRDLVRLRLKPSARKGILRVSL